MARQVLTVLTTAATVAATLAAAPGAAAAAPRNTLHWQPCEQNPQVQCATLTLPVDWSDPGDGTFEMAVARRPAADEQNRIGALLYMPGGPGGSGVDVLQGGGGLPSELTDRFDLVSFDPRGTNRSHPVVCSRELVEQRPETVPEAGGSLDPIQDYARRLGKDCREHTGPMIDHVDTVSVAHDLDAFRAALGERTWSLYGISYGTMTGQMYAEQYPHRVRALVLDSVFDHSISPMRFLESEARTGEDSFTEFVKWCDADTDCVLHGRDVRALFGQLYDRALRGELYYPDSTRPMGAMDLISGVNGLFYVPAWADAAELLMALEQQEPPESLAQPELTEFPLASFCADHEVRVDWELEYRWLWRRMNHNAPTVRGHFAWPLMLVCSAWPAETANPQHRVDIDHTPPILLLNSLHDPATPYEWASHVDRQIRQGVLLTYEGWGHGVISRSDCTFDATVDYLIDGAVPAPGTRCAAVPPPDSAPQSANQVTPLPW